MGPMLWDLDEQFPGSIGGIGGSAAVECGFLPFRFRRKKIGKWSDRPTDRPRPRVVRVHAEKGGRGEHSTAVEAQTCSF